MKAKDEFFQLISTSFTSQEIETIRIETDKREEKIKLESVGDAREIEVSLKAYYYGLCSSFYISGKDFKTFRLNLPNRELSKDYPKYVLDEEDKEYRRKETEYEDTLRILTNFVNGKPIPNGVKWDESFLHALANAIFLDIYARKSSQNSLDFYKALKQMECVSSAISKGGKITRIGFDVDNRNVGSICNADSIANFWDDFINYTSHRHGSIQNLDKTISELENQVRDSMKRIVLRICMVFVHYGILSKTTDSNNYILKNENEDYISLEQGVMDYIYEMIVYLGLKFKIRKGENGVNLSSRTSKEKADKVKSLLRKGTKELSDNFSYSKIDEQYRGCLLFQKS